MCCFGISDVTDEISVADSLRVSDKSEWLLAEIAKIVDPFVSHVL